jgi:hypothetical protein
MHARPTATPNAVQVSSGRGAGVLAAVLLDECDTLCHLWLGTPATGVAACGGAQRPAAAVVAYGIGGFRRFYDVFDIGV